LRAGGENGRHAACGRDAAGDDYRFCKGAEGDPEERRRADGSGVAARFRPLHDDEIDAVSLRRERVGPRLHVCRDESTRSRAAYAKHTPPSALRHP
jgi:hypothetical protein